MTAMMNWIGQAKCIFKANKPAHFTQYQYCEECAEHDETLVNAEIDTLSLNELGNPGWDPICFCSEEGKKYYMPAFIRLSLESINDEFYFGQLLFHLESDGEGHHLIQSCNAAQREFIAAFIAYMIDTFPEAIEINGYTDDVLRVHALWTGLS